MRHIPVEELSVPTVEDADRLVRRAGGQRGPGALEGTVERPARSCPGARRLRPPASRAPRRGSVRRAWRPGKCCSAVTNARRTESRYWAISAGSAPSGAASESGMASPRWIRATSGEGATHVGATRGPCPSASTALHMALHVDADIGRDAIKPRPNARAPFEAVCMAPGTQHRLLYGVFGLESRTEHPISVARQLSPVRLEVRTEQVGLRKGHRGTLAKRTLTSRSDACSERRCSWSAAVRVQWREESLQGGHRSIGLPRAPGLRQTVRITNSTAGFTPSPTWLPTPRRSRGARRFLDARLPGHDPVGARKDRRRGTGRGRRSTPAGTSSLRRGLWKRPSAS